MSKTVRMIDPKTGEVWKFEPKAVQKWVARGWTRAPAEGAAPPGGKRDMFAQMLETGQRMPEHQQEALRVAQPATNLLPLVGGAFGPQGAAIGALLRQGLSVEPPQPMLGAAAGYEPGSLNSRLLDIGESAGAVRLGNVAATGLVKAGKGIASLGLKGDMRAAGTALNFNVAATKAGRAKLIGKDGLIPRLGRVVREGARAASAEGWSVPGYEVGMEAARRLLADDIITGASSNIPRKQVLRLLKMFLDSRGGQLSAERLHVVKQIANRLSRPVFRALDEGRTAVDPKLAMQAHWHKKLYEVADELLAGVEQNGVRVPAMLGGRPVPFIPKYAEANSVMSDLIHLKDIVVPVSKQTTAQRMMRLPGYAAGAGLGSLVGASQGSNIRERSLYGLGGAAAGLYFGSPSKLVWLGRRLVGRRLAGATKLIPRVADTALASPEQK